jgi:signal transduction histidine kinase
MAREQTLAVACADGDDSVMDPHPGATSSVHLADQELRHELRNALTAALGYAAWLRRRSSRWTDQRDRHALEVVHSGLRLASRLVQENHAAETRTHSDLRQVAAIAVSQVPPPRLGDVVVNCLTELPLVGRWDQERLVQVLNNLLGNAVKYSPGGTPIVVEIARLGDRGRILVRDRGIGIEAQDLDVIFEGHRTELGRLVSSGSGIGLGLSRRLVEAEGGQLGVSSSPGSGSAFWVDLPLTPPSGLPSARSRQRVSRRRSRASRPYARPFGQ